MAKMTHEEMQSQLNSGGRAPACMYWNPDNGPGARLYAAYNCGGPQETRGLNYRGEPCPLWQDLPEAVKAKWNRAAAEVGPMWDLEAKPATLTVHAAGQSLIIEGQAVECVVLTGSRADLRRVGELLHLDVKVFPR